MNTNATSIEMANAIKEYAEDPNCWAVDWISDKSFNHWSKEEKDAFIAAGMAISAIYRTSHSTSLPVS